MFDSPGSFWNDPEGNEPLRHSLRLESLAPSCLRRFCSSMVCGEDVVQRYRDAMQFMIMASSNCCEELCLLSVHYNQADKDATVSL